jgi:hypothetical protein
MDGIRIANLSGNALLDIQGIEDLRQRFDQDKGLPRLILLFSPT